MLKKYLVDTPKFYWDLFKYFVIIALVMHFFPSIFPFKLFDFFFFHFDMATLYTIPWTLLLFGPGLALIATILTKNKRESNLEIVENYGKKIKLSLKAGIFEEVQNRWILFTYLIFAFTLDNLLLNWLTSFAWIQAIVSLPWLGLTLSVVGINILGLIAYALIDSEKFGCFISWTALGALFLVAALDLSLILIFTKYWYVSVMLPLVNWLTLGKLSFQLFETSWMVGAALITSNWNFGIGHAMHGPIAWIDAWIFGMIMFFFTFHFGLLFAMLIHALYDIVLNTIVYIDAKVELAIDN